MSRIINALQYKRGIEKVYIVAEKDNEGQLCFHYNPDIISINQVEQLARKAGAEITELYGHLLIEVSGVSHPGHAGIIEAQIKSLKGISIVSVSGIDFIQLEFNKKNIKEETVIEQIDKPELKIKKVEDFHVHKEIRNDQIKISPSK